MTDPEDTLEERIRAARDTTDSQAKTTKAENDAESMNTGMRAGAELIGAIGGGGFIGWALDRWLDTQPWFLILMLFLGVCTGFFNVYRLTQTAPKK